MVIQLMVNYQPDILVDKTPELKKEIDGKVKDGSSVLEPTFIVKAEGTDYNNSNYLYIPSLERYYFIRNFVQINGGLVELICKEDSLRTFANGLRLQSGIIARQEQEYNTYIPDGTFKAYAYPLIQQKSFPSGFSDEPSIILSLAGGTNNG